jgi:hypothetical protein
VPSWFIYSFWEMLILFCVPFFFKLYIIRKIKNCVYPCAHGERWGGRRWERAYMKKFTSRLECSLCSIYILQAWKTSNLVLLIWYSRQGEELRRVMWRRSELLDGEVRWRQDSGSPRFAENMKDGHGHALGRRELMQQVEGGQRHNCKAVEIHRHLLNTALGQHHPFVS